MLSEPHLTASYIDSVLDNLGVMKVDIEPYLDRAIHQIDKAKKLGASLEVKHIPTVFQIRSEHRLEGDWTTQQLINLYKG